MQISFDVASRMSEIIDMGYDGYRAEAACHEGLPVMAKADFAKNFEGAIGAVALENDWLTGYLLYDIYKNACNISAHCCAAAGDSREKTASYLFQAIAERAVDEGVSSFNIHIYANDTALQRLFLMTQFCYMSEKCVRRLSAPVGRNVCDIDIRELPKSELSARWGEVWLLLDKLLDHLRLSPVFYPCGEFTEDVYREYFMDAGTRVYVAEKGGSIAGIIELNAENLGYWFPNGGSANVGEIYVLPEFRGGDIADRLLNFAETAALSEGREFMWVEHGTANPTARAFWNKRFETVEYELIRENVRSQKKR